jgi:hypothetical protein
MGSSTLLSRPTLRSRRRLATWAYVLAALSAGYVLLRALTGTADSHVELSWRTAVSARLDLPLAAQAKGKGRARKPQPALGRKGDATRRPAPRPQEAPSAFQPHTWRRDGLLDVNPGGRHPIFDLIERAQHDWDEKLARQSRSLDEAVAEYRRRYGRAPPKGFDRWCVSRSVCCSLLSDTLFTGGTTSRSTTSCCRTSTT